MSRINSSQYYEGFGKKQKICAAGQHEKYLLILHIPGCLIGFACQIAFEKGYDGFVSLIPKTKLIDYYRNKFGFLPMGTHLAVFAASAQKIILKYLKHEEI